MKTAFVKFVEDDEAVSDSSVGSSCSITRVSLAFRDDLNACRRTHDALETMR